MQLNRVLMSALLSGVLSAPLATAEDDAYLEEGYGTVKSVSEEKIVLMEYDLDSDADVAHTYLFDSDTSFANIDSYAEIPVGSEVSVGFTRDGERRTVKEIEVIFAETDSESGSRRDTEPTSGDDGDTYKGWE